MNLFCVGDEKGVKSERKGEYTIQNFTQKEKESDLMASKQANEINIISKESKADSTGNGKGRARSNFPCVRLRKRIRKKGRKSTKRKNGERIISIPWNSEKRSEQQEQCE